MKRKRRTHSAEFKAKVALEALKGVKTINRIAQEEGVLPVQVSVWKKELQEGLPSRKRPSVRPVLRLDMKAWDRHVFRI